MKSRSKQLPPADFCGGPACGAAFDGYGITRFPRSLRIPHRGRLYCYRLHFKRTKGQTVFSYRFKGEVSESCSFG